MNDVQPDTEVSERSSLPLLLGVLVVVGAAAGVIYALQIGRGQNEAAALEALKALGGIAQSGATSKRVESLTMVAANAQSKIPEAMPHIANLGALKHLDLSRTNVTDDHLKTVGKLPSLTSLGLNETGITDGGVMHLGNLKLQSLHLAKTKITGKSMEIIGQMSELKNLDLSHTEVEDNLAPLANLIEVNWIVLGGIELDEDSIQVLANMPALKQLSIIGTDLDESLEQLLLDSKPTITIQTEMAGGNVDAYGNTSEEP